MALVVFLLTYNCLLVAGYVQYRWTRRQPGAPPLPKRMTNAELASFGIRQLALAGLLTYTFFRGTWTFESVGIRQDTSWLESILVGEVAFFLLIGINLAILWMTRTVGRMRLAAIRGNLRAWPRGRVAKGFARLFIMGFNPFTEELVMRGILIHQWGLLLGSPAIPIAIGLVLNGALHWYQGWRMQLWHAMFFCIVVTLLYSPWGLAAAITAHVFGDVMPFLHLRRQLLRARADRRALPKDL